MEEENENGDQENEVEGIHSKFFLLEPFIELNEIG